MLKETTQKLEEFQSEIDNLTSEYLEADFKLKLEHHKKMAPLLEKRDAILKEQLSHEELMEIYSKAAENFSPFKELFVTSNNEEYDLSFIKSFKAEYLDGFKVKVTFEFLENKYIEDKKIEKTISFFESESDSCVINWKDKQEGCPLFEFFESKEDDFDIFDIIYEFYVDLLFLAEIECE